MDLSRFVTAALKRRRSADSDVAGAHVGAAFNQASENRGSDAGGSPRSNLTWRRIAVGLSAAGLMLAACQSTTSQTSDSDRVLDAYPGTDDSPGLTDSSITIALPGVSDSKSPNWETYGPVSAALNRLVDELNADGGIAGRTINPVWGYDAITGGETSPEEFVEHLCSLSVDENSSFARHATSRVEELSNLEQSGCVGPTHTINVVIDTIVAAGLLEDTADVVAPYALDDVTAAHVLVDRLTEQGFFDGANRIAVLSPSGDYAAIAENVLVADLKEAGIADPLVLTGTAGTDLTQASAKSLVLQMKTENVDRVVYFDNDHYNAYFVEEMIAQKYTPPIGTLTSASPDYSVRLGYPADQMFAVSWLAGFALGKDGEATLASLPDTPTSQECAALSESTGLKIATGTEELLLGGCDTLALLEESFKASGAAEPSTAAFFAGLEKLTDFDSAYGVTLDFSHGRTGVSHVWDLKGDVACNCMRIVGDPHLVERG